MINRILLRAVSILVIISSLVICYPDSTIEAATASIKITRYASDHTTVLLQKILTYQQMEESLPVLGDGTTHYYLQGPVFLNDSNPETQAMLRWNPAEDTNVQDKDMGALKGTNLKVLCEQAGGMEEGDTLKVKSSDGWNREFKYKNVYEYSSREGPMVLTWWKDGKYPDSGYSEGMRVVWFADTSTNPWGIHAMGNWDWHEASEEDDWYFYYQGSEKFPTTTGLSGQKVSELEIYSNDPVPAAAFTSSVQSGVIPLTVQFTDQSTIAGDLTYAWDFDNDGTVDSTAQNPMYTNSIQGRYSLKLTVTGSSGSKEQIKNNYITAAPVWDLNADGKCDMSDIVLIGQNWLSTGAPGWVPEDINHDGAVNISDVVRLGLHWQETW